MSIAQVRGENPRARTASSSGAASLDSWLRPVSTRRARGRPVLVQTAAPSMIYDATTLELADETGLRPSLVADLLAVRASAGNTSGGATFLRGNPDPYFVATALRIIADSRRKQRFEQSLADMVAQHGQ